MRSRLLTTDEVCEWLRVSRDTVRGLIRTGQIEEIRIGVVGRRLVRIPEDSVHAYLRRDDEPSPSPDPRHRPRREPSLRERLGIRR